MASAPGWRQCSIWAQAADQQAAEAAAAGAKTDSFVYVVGSRGSGKTTLINRILYSSKAEVPAPSDSLEYTFARKGGSTGFMSGDDRQLAHFWEMGGHEEVALSLAKADHLFLTFKQVTSAVVVICVDMTDPGSVLSNAEAWLGAIRSKLAVTYAAFERKGLQLPDQLRQRARLRLGANHEDKDAVDVTGISLVLAATKWDTFCSRDSEEQRVMGLALRCLAHANGAHLVYLGGLQPGGGAGAEGARDSVIGSAGVGGSAASSVAQQAAALDNFVRMINHLVFSGLDKKLTLKVPPQIGNLSPLMVPAGADKLRSIGVPGRQQLPPAGVALAAADMAAAVQEWRTAVTGMFQASKVQDSAPIAAARRLVSDARYGEEDVDAARARWQEAMADYTREETVPEKKSGSATAALNRLKRAPGGSSSGPGSGGKQQPGASAAAAGSIRVR